MLDRSREAGRLFELLNCMDLDPRVIWAISEMRRRVSNRINMAELARRANLSRSRFTHLFRQQIGVSPSQYLHDYRLDRARLFLETTTLSVKDVMTAVGFTDPSHFSRDFRTKFGVSPREWRRQRGVSEVAR